MDLPQPAIVYVAMQLLKMAIAVAVCVNMSLEPSFFYPSKQYM